MPILNRVAEMQDEIAGWSSASEEEKLATWNRLLQRADAEP